MDKDQLATTLELAKSTYGTGGGGMNWPLIISGLIFGTIGFVAFMYGKKEKSAKPLIIGLILMVYPYLVPNVSLSYVIGIALIGVLYFWRN